jgi:hypothetical protein
MWKAVRRPLGAGLIEVYNVSKDSSEEMDVSKKRSDWVERFEKLFAEAHVPVERWKVLGRPEDRAAARTAGK